MADINPQSVTFAQLNSYLFEQTDFDSFKEMQQAIESPDGGLKQFLSKEQLDVYEQYKGKYEEAVEAKTSALEEQMKPLQAKMGPVSQEGTYYNLERKYRHQEVKAQRDFYQHDGELRKAPLTFKYNGKEVTYTREQVEKLVDDNSSFWSDTPQEKFYEGLKDAYDDAFSKEFKRQYHDENTPLGKAVKLRDEASTYLQKSAYARTNAASYKINDLRIKINAAGKEVEQQALNLTGKEPEVKKDATTENEKLPTEGAKERLDDTAVKTGENNYSYVPGQGFIGPLPEQNIVEEYTPLFVSDPSTEEVVEKPKVVIDPATQEVQAYVTALGFDAGPIDGVHGDKTTGGLYKYANANGIEGYGAMSDADLRDAVLKDINLKIAKDSGFRAELQGKLAGLIESGDANNIKAAQVVMNDMGIKGENGNALAVDGIAGTQTSFAASALDGAGGGTLASLFQNAVGDGQRIQMEAIASIKRVELAEMDIDVGTQKLTLKFNDSVLASAEDKPENKAKLEEIKNEGESMTFDKDYADKQLEEAGISTRQNNVVITNP